MKDGREVCKDSQGHLKYPVISIYLASPFIDLTHSLLDTVNSQIGNKITIDFIPKTTALLTII